MFEVANHLSDWIAIIKLSKHFFKIYFDCFFFNILLLQNTQSHPTSLIQTPLPPLSSSLSSSTTSSSSNLTANTSLVSNYGRLPSSTTKHNTINATSSTVYSTSSSSSSSSGSSTSSTPKTQQQATDASGNPLPPQGAEIKIPAVGATPVAVSTKLPAAVQQLTQQGMFSFLTSVFVKEIRF